MQSLGLGKHVDDSLMQHQEEHSKRVGDEQERRQAGREERKEMAENLGNKLAQGLEQAGKWQSEEELGSTVPKELENGTMMYVHLQPIGTFEEAVKAICSPKYVNEGALSSQHKGRSLTEQEVANQKLEYGIIINVSLHSRDEELDVDTKHQVHVGNLLDPESLLVPNADEGGKRFEVIGSDDSRFASIMDLVGSFFGSDNQRISEELASVS